MPAEENPPELTFRSLLLGATLGILFGAASTYLALRVGLTVSASIPVAVIAIALLKSKKGQRSILEHNISQTVGSAGESVAAAMVFTVPALIFLGYPLHVGLTTLIALTGGLLGVLMMVPLRRYLIVKEHGVLRYPEGKACAEILIAGEKGGSAAKKVFWGMGIGALFKTFQSILRGVPGSLEAHFDVLKGSRVACEFEPPLLGVGYILGYRTSVMMVAGSLLSSFVLIPLIYFFGSGSPNAIYPAVVPISQMDIDTVWRNYVRYIGAGAVATGGIFGLVRALPAIASSLKSSAQAVMGGDKVAHNSTLRTDRDTPISVLMFGSVAIVLFIWLMPSFQMNLLGAILILLLGFLFSVVSSRITGEVGSTSSPLSGMTIGVLMGTCGAFLLAGWEGSTYSRLALMIGAIICVAISNAGTCSQDLKTGFLVGATPIRQQGALLIGVLTSVVAVGWTAYGLNLSETKETPITAPFVVRENVLQRGDEIESKTDGKTYRFVRLDTEDLPAGQAAGNYLIDTQTREVRYARQDGIGGERFPAPQARLMSVVIDGLLTHKLPWDLILLGVAIAIFVEILGMRSLTFAVGVYLPLASTMPVFLGGLVRKLADWYYKRPADAEDEQPGTLFSSGLIAGASLIGIVTAMLAFLPGYDGDNGYYPALAVLRDLPFASSIWWGSAVLGLLAYLIFRAAKKTT